MPTEKEFRQAGFTAKAINYPLSERAFAWLCRYNGITPEQAPEAWKYAPNETMQARLDELANTAEQS